MRWFLLLALMSCANKSDSRWCAHPTNKFKRCYETEEKCMDAQAETHTGVTCRPAEML